MEKQHNEAVVVAYGRSAVAKSGKKGALRQNSSAARASSAVTGVNFSALSLFSIQRTDSNPAPPARFCTL